MSHGRNAPQEVIHYRRSEAIPGIEVVDARNSPRQWRVICPDFAVVVFSTWQGSVQSRGRLHAGVPGSAFCNTPGEAMVASPEHAGSFDVIEIKAALLEEWLAEQQPNSVRPDWVSVIKPLSRSLLQQFRGFFAEFRPSATPMELQSRLLELSEAMISELISGAREQPRVDGPPIRGTARMRECLNEEGLDIDLDTLARHAGLSRFQALRAFKRRYGLPPHAYQLCLRVSHARRMLLEGASASEVSAACGFVDQSHFTRHFKRLVGTTPMQYARGEAHSELRNAARRARNPELEFVSRPPRV